ncbi:OadG family transporter subunit [Streptococcus sp. H31]|uniref:OadG family transporter subunit n=1 Tax=Streptococcus huangxiaojuni TaxID=3237239 RepID=UPI0034A2842C
MEHISIMEALSLSVVAITVVMVVLVGLMFIIEGFRFIENSQSADSVSPAQPASQEKGQTLADNEELKLVAALTALAVASDNKQDKKYRITAIKRIK